MRLLLLFLNVYFTVQPQAASHADIVRKFLFVKQQSYQQNATKENIEAVLDFCSDSVKYDHVLSPDKKFSFDGKKLWRSGAISHLGETRNVKIVIAKLIEKQNLVMVEYELSREVKSGQTWEPSKSTIVSVIEFDKANKIARMTDYL